MAETTSAARPYARAVFELARSTKKGLKQWSALLQVAALVASEPGMSRLLGSPGLSAQEKAELFLSLCSEISGEAITEQGRNFIKLLAENRRLVLLPLIVAQYEALKAEAEKTLYAEVVTALPIDDAQRSKLAAALKARLQREVSLEVTIDESLIGGAVIRIGDMVIDGSARGQLQRLATALSQ